MDIRIRVVTHTADEISMGQVIFYAPLPEADGVSVTANANGFTTLTAVARRWDVPLHDVEHIADHANSLKNKCPWALVLEEPFKHCLIVIPKIRGTAEITAMTTKLLEDADGEHVRVVEFSHFNFIQGEFPAAEIRTILRTIIDWESGRSLRAVIFDIDERYLDEFLALKKVIEQTPRTPVNSNAVR